MAQGAPAGPAAPWAGWGAEVETGVASPREDRGDPGETRLEGASSTAPGTGSAPTREYPKSLLPTACATGSSQELAWAARPLPKSLAGPSQEAASPWHRGRDEVTPGGCG